MASSSNKFNERFQFKTCSNARELDQALENKAHQHVYIFYDFGQNDGLIPDHFLETQFFPAVTLFIRLLSAVASPLSPRDENKEEFQTLGGEPLINITYFLKTLSQATHLVSLTLENISRGIYGRIEDHFKFFFQQLSSLTNITIVRETESVLQTEILKAASCSSSLKTICLSTCGGPANMWFIKVAQEAIENNKKWECFDIVGVRTSGEPSQLSFIQALSVHPTLKTVGIIPSYYSSENFDALCRFIILSPNLTHLKVDSDILHTRESQLRSSIIERFQKRIEAVKDTVLPLPIDIIKIILGYYFIEDFYLNNGKISINHLELVNSCLKNSSLLDNQNKKRKLENDDGETLAQELKKEDTTQPADKRSAVGGIPASTLTSSSSTLFASLPSSSTAVSANPHHPSPR